MSPTRLAIRQETVRRLRCAGTVAGTRYYSNRFRPVMQANVPAIEQPNLPCGVVYTLTETAESNEGAPREYRRVLEMAIELIVARAESSDNDADDRLDQLIEQVEAVLAFDPTLGQDRVDVTYLRTDLVPLDEGDLAFAAARVTYQVVYYQVVPEGDADDLPPWERADVRQDARAGSGGRALIEDLIEVGGP